MTTNHQTTIISDLAHAFSDVLKEWLSQDQLRTVIHLNTSGVYSELVCASHDFCDANMAMLEAFIRVLGREPMINDDADLGLWNSAWAMAKAASFFVDPI